MTISNQPPLSSNPSLPLLSNLNLEFIGKINPNQTNPATLGDLFVKADPKDEKILKLIADFKNKSDAVSEDAVKALGIIGLNAKAAVTALIKALNDQDQYVRYFADKTLDKIGPDAKDAVEIPSGSVEEKEILNALKKLVEGREILPNSNEQLIVDVINILESR